MSLQDAIAAPRYFAMASGQVHLEGRLPGETVNGLKTLGYDVNIRSNWDPYFGGVQGVLFDRGAKILYGGADPRRDGEARGY
jgi:gamma-glutamyltranspeptidase/glutathione hydrolase